MTSGGDEPIPVHLVTGFLGSGKTTLLRRLLTRGVLDDAAILINEFGEIGLDHRLIAHAHDRIRLLERGCACCNVRDDLRQSLEQLLAARRAGGEAFDRIVIESSGLADPAPILYTLRNDSALRRYLVPGQVIATVDAINGLRALDRHAEIAKQIALADRLVITKTDLAEPDAIAALAHRLREINPAAAIIDVGRLTEPASLFERSGIETVRPATMSIEAGHLADIRSFILTYDDQIDWAAFTIWLTMLLNRHGEQVLRVKGIISVAGSQTPTVIHGVQHIMHPPEHLDAWPDDDHRSHIVFIVRGIDPAAIRISLDAMLDLGAAVRRDMIEAA
jgi:G3E family GTPase